MSVRVRVRERAKVRMQMRDGAKAAAKIGTKAAAEQMLAKVAKVGAAKGWGKGDGVKGKSGDSRENNGKGKG